MGPSTETLVAKAVVAVVVAVVVRMEVIRDLEDSADLEVKGQATVHLASLPQQDKIPKVEMVGLGLQASAERRVVAVAVDNGGFPLPTAQTTVG